MRLVAGQPNPVGAPHLTRSSGHPERNGSLPLVSPPHLVITGGRCCCCSRDFFFTAAAVGSGRLAAMIAALTAAYLWVPVAAPGSTWLPATGRHAWLEQRRGDPPVLTGITPGLQVKRRKTDSRFTFTRENWRAANEAGQVRRPPPFIVPRACRCPATPSGVALPRRVTATSSMLLSVRALSSAAQGSTKWCSRASDHP